MANKQSDKSGWVIGGLLLVGMGVGFIFIQDSPLLFVASLFIGLGLGLALAPIVSK
ncbi:MAG: hypothetical protein K9L85_01935 [Candidatus Peribacteraceae bacterium]|nr:hypothetical protein [Candidatus Peribacteraceae bacterium]